MTAIHYPWDDGSLHELGLLTGQKSIKAACGKRVPFKSASSTGRVSCPQCRKVLEQRVNETQKIVDAYQDEPTAQPCRSMIAKLRRVLADQE